MPQLDVAPNGVAESSLADYTRSELIVHHLRERDIPGIIGELCQVLHREGCVPDLLPFYRSAAKRADKILAVLDEVRIRQG
jgi:hypothetical protein